MVSEGDSDERNRRPYRRLQVASTWPRLGYRAIIVASHAEARIMSAYSARGRERPGPTKAGYCIRQIARLAGLSPVMRQYYKIQQVILKHIAQNFQTIGTGILGAASGSGGPLGSVMRFTMIADPSPSKKLSLRSSHFRCSRGPNSAGMVPYNWLLPKSR